MGRYNDKDAPTIRHHKWLEYARATLGKAPVPTSADPDYWPRIDALAERMGTSPDHARELFSEIEAGDGR